MEDPATDEDEGFEESTAPLRKSTRSSIFTGKMKEPTEAAIKDAMRVKDEGDRARAVGRRVTSRGERSEGTVVMNDGDDYCDSTTRKTTRSLRNVSWSNGPI